MKTGWILHPGKKQIDKETLILYQLSPKKEKSFASAYRSLKSLVQISWTY
jgi:hypothetical protein